MHPNFIPGSHKLSTDAAHLLVPTYRAAMSHAHTGTLTIYMLELWVEGMEKVGGGGPGAEVPHFCLKGGGGVNNNWKFLWPTSPN